MKRYKLIILAVCLIFLTGFAHATDWSKPDKGYFKLMGDFEKNFASYNAVRTMATVNYNGKVFNFTNYRSSPSSSSKILLRKLSNTGQSDIKWSSSSVEDNITNLTDLGSFDYQPAPVMYNNALYLFVGNKSGGIGYSVYNAAQNSWSALTNIDINISKQLGSGMSAVVIEDKLCLVYQENKGQIHIIWTNDLTTWHEYWTGIYGVDPKPSNTSTYYQYCQMSAINTHYMYNGVKKEKLRFAYIDQNYHPVSVEYYFADNNDLYFITSQVISSETKYISVVLAEGTVSGDPTSSGSCVQAFLKLDHSDDYYRRFRIQRYQLKNSSWTKAENNLVKENYGWANTMLNLTAVNFPVLIGNDIRQFMCLIYLSNNDWTYPLNCAYVETNKLVYDPSGEKTQTLGGPETTQYVGYIEGPPPFYVNNAKGVDNPYVSQNLFIPISEVEFSTSSSTSSESEIGFDVGGSIELHAGIFKGELSYTFAQKWGSEYKRTITQSFSTESGKESLGKYICVKPVVTRAQYLVYDVNNNIIDTTFYFTMSDPEITQVAAELKNGLNPADPLTYQNRKSNNKQINFASYSSSSNGNVTNSWIPGGKSSVSIDIDSSKSSTITNNAELKLDFELGHFFAVGAHSSIETSFKVTTGSGNGIKCITALNEPVDSTDITALNYHVYWLKPIFGKNIDNWWLHEGATDQNTWCVTYDVTYLKRKNGRTNQSISQPWQVGEPVAAPVVISSFTGSQTGAGITLAWKTSTEVNNYGFEIQRLSSGSGVSNANYETIGFVAAQGNSTSPAQYSYTDVNPLTGKTNYRLKQINTDKNVRYSDAVEIKVDKQLPTEFSLSQNYPNPFNPSTKIRYQIAEDKLQSNSSGQMNLTRLVVYDMLGKEVATLVNEYKEPGTYEVEWNGSQIISGVYFYRLQCGSFNAVKKLLLLK